MLVLTAALVAPYFIDWTSYRAAFEREAGRILGREVRVEGTARARLIPFPSVTFTEVVVAGSEPGATAMTVDEFSMDAELAPFLSGELLIFDMRLVGPRMNIEVDADGRIDWAVRPSTQFDPRQVTLENVTVRGGAIRLHQRASGRTTILDNINAKLSARSLAGPWRVDGALRIDGNPVTVSAATGTANTETGMRVRITAQPEQYPFLLETDGQARFAGEAGLYSGTFRLRTTASGEAGEERVIAHSANRVSGRFTLDHQRLAVDEFRFETGPSDDPYIAEGKAAIELGSEPSFLVEASGAQIRLGVEEGEGGLSGLSVDERLAAFTRFIADLPEPAIPGTIAIDLPAIVAGDTTLRNIRLRAQPVEQGWQIGSLAATLPGRTRLEGEGVLATGESLSFKGHLLLAVSQPSGFAAWLARDVDEAIRRLPAAGFSADVTLTSERQHFDNLELILGDARFTGEIDRQSRSDTRPSIALKLGGDSLDVDDMRAFASLFISDAGQHRLADHDVDLEVVAGPVFLQDLSAEKLDTSLRLREGRIEIDRLALTGLADANISATGYLAGLSEQTTGQLDATLVSVDLAPLLELLAKRFPDNSFIVALDRHAEAYPGLFADSEIDIVASAARDGDEAPGLSVSARGLAGGTGFSLSLSSSTVRTEDAQLAVDFIARNDEAAALYALFGLPALPLGLAGEGDVEFSAVGNRSEGFETTFSMSGQDLSARFTGRIDSAAKGFSAFGEAQIESGDLEPWLAIAGISLPGFGYGLPVEASAALDFREGTLLASELSGRVAQNEFQGGLEGRIENGRPQITGSLQLGGLDLRTGIEMVLGPAAFEDDSKPWPQGPFSQATNIPISSDLQLSVDHLWIGDTASFEDARFHFRLGPNGFTLSDLTARHFGGTLEGLAELRNEDGTGLFSAQFSLGGVPIKQLLPEGKLSGLANLHASVTASGKSVSSMVASLAGSGSVLVEDLMIFGFDPEALLPIIEAADEFGIEVDADHVKDFAPPLVRNGSFAAGDVEFAFTLAQGVARMPTVQLQSNDAQMSVEAAADLNRRTVSVDGSISYDAGLEAVAGSEPSVRFSLNGAPQEVEPVLDTEPLAQFLSQRALELEQARVEHMQDVLLERQRLRREQRFFSALAKEREAAEEARRAEEAERLRLQREAERARKAAEERERQMREALEAQRDEENSRPEEGIPSDLQPAGDIEDGFLEAPAWGDLEIERRSLPAPEPQGMEDAPPGPRERAENEINTQNLTVEQLLHHLNEERVR